MNKYPKPLSISPQARLPDGAKILFPQKVDLSPVGKQAFSRSQHNIEAGFNKSPRVKKTRNETIQDIQYKDHMGSGNPYRPDTAQGNIGNDHFKGLGGILKNTSTAPRPTTSGEGYLRRPLQSPKGEQPNRPESKLNKLASLFPTSKDMLAGRREAVEPYFESTKEDREAVQDLERWDSEFKILAVSKNIETDQKKDNNQMPFKSEYFESVKTPVLNREIIGLIDDDEGYGFEKDLKLAAASNISKINKQKARIPQKSLETIMSEYNKKILNEILFSRVSKKLTNKDSPTHNKLDLDYTTKTVSTDTIGNFKNLQHTLQTNPRIIEYENLYHKLTVQRNPPEKVFDFEEDCKRIQDAENDYASIETGLKAQYEGMIAEIHKKKEILNEIRLNVHNNNNEITEIEEEIEDTVKKYEAIEAQHNQHKEQTKMLARSNTRIKRGGIKEAPKSGAFVEEYSKFQRQMDEKKEQIRELKEAIQNLETDNKKNQQKASNFEREIKDLKFKKNQIRIQLKQLYFKMLKNEEHIFKNEASFITIIKNLWRINEEVVEDIFPSFVDREALGYLVENAKLEYELEQLENLTRGPDARDYRYNDPQQREEARNKFRESQKSMKAPLSEQLVDVRKRLQNLKKGIVKMKKPFVIRDGTSNSRVIRWEELHLGNDEWDNNQINEQSIQEKINNAIATIKAKLADLKEKEINRIFHLYLNREIDEKNLRSLNKILISLFGRHDAEKTYHLFIRVKQAHDLKISQNKTFVFSSTKQFSSSMNNDKTKNSTILMLSNATNFKNEKPKNPLKELEEKEKKKVSAEGFTKQLDQYQEIDNLEVNFNYNLNFNYASGYQNKDLQSSFYLSKHTSPKEMGSNLKSSMRDKDRMTKTTESFTKVSFKEPARPYI